MFNSRLIIVSQMVCTGRQHVGMFWSKIPMVTAVRRSWAFAINASLRGFWRQTLPNSYLSGVPKMREQPLCNLDLACFIVFFCVVLSYSLYEICILQNPSKSTKHRGSSLVLVMGSNGSFFFAFGISWVAAAQAIPQNFTVWAGL